MEKEVNQGGSGITHYLIHFKKVNRACKPFSFSLSQHLLFQQAGNGPFWQKISRKTENHS